MLSFAAYSSARVQQISPASARTDVQRFPSADDSLDGVADPVKLMPPLQSAPCGLILGRTQPAFRLIRSRSERTEIPPRLFAGRPPAHASRESSCLARTAGY